MDKNQTLWEDVVLQREQQLSAWVHAETNEALLF